MSTKALNQKVDEFFPTGIFLAFTNGFDTPLWTIARLQSMFSSDLGVKLSCPTIHRFLTEAGFSFQKPEKRAFQQDPKRRPIGYRKHGSNWKKTQKRSVLLFYSKMNAQSQ